MRLHVFGYFLGGYEEKERERLSYPFISQISRVFLEPNKGEGHECHQLARQPSQVLSLTYAVGKQRITVAIYPGPRCTRITEGTPYTLREGDRAVARFSGLRCFNSLTHDSHEKYYSGKAAAVRGNHCNGQKKDILSCTVSGERGKSVRKVKTEDLGGPRKSLGQEAGRL